MVHRKDFEVDGQSYVITQFASTRGLKVLTKLTKLLGPSVANMVDGKGAGSLGEVVPTAVNALVMRLDENEVIGLVKDDLMSCVTFENQQLNGPAFDLHFQGRFGRLFKLAAEVVRFNYEDFLSVLVAAGARDAAAKK